MFRKDVVLTSKPIFAETVHRFGSSPLFRNNHNVSKQKIVSKQVDSEKVLCENLVFETDWITIVSRQFRTIEYEETEKRDIYSHCKVFDSQEVCLDPAIPVSLIGLDSVLLISIMLRQSDRARMMECRSEGNF
jgi:hypothetical protein